MKPAGRIATWIGQHAVSAAFYVFALAGAPPLARALKAGLAAEEPLWGPGFLLLAVLFLEPLGLRWKMRFLRRRNADEGFVPQGPMLAMFSAVGIGHVIVTVFLGMLALDCWGAVGSGAEEASGWWGAVIVALVVKELVGLVAAGGNEAAREPPGHWKEWAGDVLLLAYGAVAYVAWWEALLDPGPAEWNSLAERLVVTPIFAAVFLFFYLPMRLPFLLDEYLLRPVQGRRGRLLAEMAFGAFVGLYPLFR
ncbi:MAG TPA: hypothetical protein P5204_05275 [Kiritimatiellia bacterium]|nr:hypothetical protein [Kiritimatiellia bacterium]